MRQSAFLAPASLPWHRPPPRRTTCAPRASAAEPDAHAHTAPGRDDPPAYRLAPGEVAVRFINTPTGVEAVAAARPGDPLLRVGDGVGVSIPRACQSGLCGSCTCDVVSPHAEGGVETVRACQTGVVVPEGAVEMVVDVERMKYAKDRRRNPMSRFENLDTEYVAGAAPKASGTWLKEVDCDECESKGDIECYACEGLGVEDGFDCLLCSGSGTLRCAQCQGSGVRQVRSR